MPAPANLVHETTAGTGTGNLTVAAVNGKQRLSAAFSTGASTDVFDYFISHRTAAEWERGTGHMSDANTLVRDTVIESTNTNAAVNFSAGTKDVTNDVPAAKQVVTDLAQTLTNKTLTDPLIIGAILEDIFTITDGAAFEIDPSNGTLQRVVLGASRTPAATNFVNGESVTLMVDDGTAYAITWSTVGVVWVGGVAPTLATAGFTIIELWKEGNVIRGALVGSTAS